MLYVQICRKPEPAAAGSGCSQQQLHVLVKTLARSVTQSPRARYWLRCMHIPPATARPRQRLKKATVSGKSADAQSFIYDTGGSAVEILAKKPSNTQKWPWGAKIGASVLGPGNKQSSCVASLLSLAEGVLQSFQAASLAKNYRLVQLWSL